MREAPSLYKNTYQSTNDILSRLQKVKRVGDGRYIALCPCHNDSKPSLNVTIKPEGKWIMRCFSCGANGQAVCDALGIDVTLLFPPNDNPRYEKQQRSGFSAWQLLHTFDKDLLVVLIATNRYLLEGEKPCQSDVDYLTSVCVRISEALQYLEGKR